MSNNNSRNEYIIRDAADTLLYLTDSYNDYREKLTDMEFVNHIESASQDIVYNLTTLIRNLQRDLDDE